MPLPGILDMAPWRTWPAAANGALEYLYAQSTWDAWLITRLVGETQVILFSQPLDAARPGASLPWAESFCRQMVNGQAPRVATVTAAVPAYASRTLPNGVSVAAYIGVPLIGRDGELFGTLCGVGARARPRTASRDLPLAELVGRLLSSLLAAGLDPGPPPEPLPLGGGMGAPL